MGEEETKKRKNNLCTAFRLLGNKNAYALLNLLENTNGLRYTSIANTIFKEKVSRQVLAYYIRICKTSNLIQKNNFTDIYTVTKKGSTILNFIKNNEEKYINENINEVCRFSKNGEHDYIKICTDCGNKLKDREKKRIEVFES